jgi:hypothetical protein
MKRETKKASKEITAVFNALRRMGAASGERIASVTRLSAATVGQVLWSLTEAGIAAYGQGSGLWILECSWFDGTDGKCASSAVEIVIVLNTMRAIWMADLDRLVEATGLSKLGAGWSCERLREIGRLEYAASFAGWKLVA